MNFDILFLPLLGGYIFFSQFNGTRYRASAFPAQRLIFPAAAIGLVLVVSAFILRDIAITFQKDNDKWLAILLEKFAIGLVFACFAIVAVAAVKRFRERKSEISSKQPGRTGPLALRLPYRGHEAAQAIVTLSGGLALLTKIVATDSARAFDLLFKGLGWGAIALGTALAVSLLVRRYTQWPCLSLAYRVAMVGIVMTMSLCIVALNSSYIESFFASYVPVPNIGIPSLSLAMGILAVVVGNWIVTREAASALLYFTGLSDQFQRLLFESLHYYRLIQVNLADSKVYIGYVFSYPCQSDATDGFFKLLPLMSGYRDSETREFTLMTKYEDVIGAISGAKKHDLRLRALEELDTRLRPFMKVIPYEQVIYAGEFDQDGYLKFAEASQRRANMQRLLEIPATPFAL